MGKKLTFDEKAKMIDQLVAEGRKILDERTSKLEAEKERIANENFKAWTALLEAARGYLPESVRDFLTYPEDLNLTSNPPSGIYDHAFKLFTLFINGLAPIRVIFHPGSFGEFSIPVISCDEGEYFYSWSTRKCGIDGNTVTEVEDLPVALALAQDRKNLMLKCLAQNTAVNQPQPEEPVQKEPTYEDLQASEPVPDQVLISSLRHLIADELRKTCAI